LFLIRLERCIKAKQPNNVGMACPQRPMHCSVIDDFNSVAKAYQLFT
jgi:hypothetical protein